MRREVQIMHHLKGHENIVTLFGAYEDKNSVHLVWALLPLQSCRSALSFNHLVSFGSSCIHSSRAAECPKLHDQAAASQKALVDKLPCHLT